jgi:hypothetical protein
MLAGRFFLTPPGLPLKVGEGVKKECCAFLSLSIGRDVDEGDRAGKTTGQDSLLLFLISLIFFNGDLKCF